MLQLFTLCLQKILPADPKKEYAVCLDGKNACPPEDCGGIWGYYELLKVVKNPKHKEHQAPLDWLGGPFDPGHFDLQKINAELRCLRNLLRPSPFSTPKVFSFVESSEPADAWPWTAQWAGRGKARPCFSAWSLIFRSLA